MSREAICRVCMGGVRKLVRFVEAIAIIFLALIFLILLAEIVSRNLFNTSLAGSWELAAMAMAGMFFFGLAPALQAGSHVRVSMLSANLDKRARRACDAIVHIVALGVSSYATLALFGLAMASLSRSSKSWELSLPLYLPQLTVAAGMGFLTMVFAARLVVILLGYELTDPEKS